MKKWFYRYATIIALAGLLSACTDPEKAREVLTDEGYTNIHIGGYNAWACSDDDDYSTEFIAVNPRGRTVSGVVCSSYWGKFATVRF